MSYDLWRSLHEHNVDTFRLHLANATYTSAPGKSQGGHTGASTHSIGSPGALATSPRTTFKSRKSSGHVQPQNLQARNRGVILSRSDVNSKDSFGRTLLHHAVSHQADEAHEFVKAMLEVPFVDLYIQDIESGWTPLHRALYFGNISSAQALMQRDIRDATDYTTQASHIHAGGLVKIKDNEGNSPFEVFGLTIAPRDIQSDQNTISSGAVDDETSNSVDLNDDSNDETKNKRLVQPAVDLRGDEVFAFGSNKNLTLGTGNGDDKHFPERLHFNRPEHVLQRLYEDRVLERETTALLNDLSASLTSNGPARYLPTLIRHKAVVIQDVAMSKLHTAVLTEDPISNLYMCGFGPGGRLGTGDEATAFTFKCIAGGGLSKHRISSIALGQDHSIAICSQGEVFTWGSNKFGQLGYYLPEVAAQETPMQLLPRQLYGLVKRETIIGAAASSIHSAIFTAQSLYTFGKNEGQLGFMDADARSMEIQTLPKRVAPSVLQSQIRSVSAIDRATSVLLENHDVIVFTHYGWTKVAFDLDGLTGHFVSESLATRNSNLSVNFIQKITSGGNTICAMSSYGEVFTIEVPKVSDAVPSNVSTTNPSKARNALPLATKVWSIRKDHMSALDVAISGQDGSIILCTTSGSVWRKEKRANIKAARDEKKVSRPKDYKFVRAPNLTRAVAVRSNAYGAFTAIRRDCEMTREQIAMDAPSLWSDIFGLLSFKHFGEIEEDAASLTPQLRFWRPATKGPSPALIKKAMITSPTAEDDILSLCQRSEPLADSNFDVWVTSNVTDVRIPVHSFVLQCRSKVLRAALAEFQETYYFAIPDIMSIEYGKDGHPQIKFQGADFLTITNLVLYLYTDEVIDVWHFTSKALQSAARYRIIRTELMKIAAALDLRQLERAARLMIDPVKSLCHDVEVALKDASLWSSADVIIDLADGAEQFAHSIMLCKRCPFFDGLFNGRAGGMWMSSRRGLAEEKSEAMRVDLKHVDEKVFQLVLRHMYADTGPELLDDVVTNDFEEFVDLVLEVISVANELMIDRLSQICQGVLGKFVTMRNVCGFLNAIADCSVTEFKQAGLEYICLNLEGMMEQRLLEELDPELLSELDEIVQANQKAYMPFARSGRADAELLERHPELPDLLEQGRQRRADGMRLRSRLAEDEQRVASHQRFRVGSLDAKNPSNSTPRTVSTATPSPGPSPAISAKDGTEDLPFEMDEDAAIGSPSLAAKLTSPILSPQRDMDELDESYGASPQIHRRYLQTSESEHTGLGIRSPSIPTSSIPTLNANSLSNLGGHAWQGSPHVGKKVDLRNIMDQTSASRPSGITQSINRMTVSQSKPVVKVSQKERKRQQQQSKDPPRLPQPETQQQASTSAGHPVSPWRKVQAPRRPSSPVAGSPARTPTPSLSSAKARPTMTMRQTVAGGKSSEKVPQMKSESNRSTSAVAPSTAPVQPTIQSIRHNPAPSRYRPDIDAHVSMADILSQQQIEKVSVKEAAEKRSLEEIQQEQEFQEWWDKESARIQEQESQLSSPGTGRRGGKGGRGRGGGRRGGARGGPAMTTTTAKSSVESGGQREQLSTYPSSSAEQRRGVGLNLGVHRGGADQTRGRGGRAQRG